MLGKSQAKAVFAHYMVRVYHHVAAAYDEVHMNWKVGTVNKDHAQTDIDDAIAIGWFNLSPMLITIV